MSCQKYVKTALVLATKLKKSTIITHTKNKWSMLYSNSCIKPCQFPAHTGRGIMTPIQYNVLQNPRVSTAIRRRSVQLSTQGAGTWHTDWQTRHTTSSSETSLVAKKFASHAFNVAQNTSVKKQHATDIQQTHPELTPKLLNILRQARHLYRTHGHI